MKLVLRCILFCFLMSSCSPKDKVKRLLEDMHGSTVSIPLDSMKCWHPEGEDYSSTREDSKLTLVVYSDTVDCSQCYLKHLELWNDFVRMEKEHEGIIRFLFIIEARDGEADNLYGQLGMTNLKHCIYVDGNRSFSKNNPQIPSNSLCHTFLLDESNKIVLIGNPIKNEAIEKIFLRKIEEAKDLSKLQ